MEGKQAPKQAAKQVRLARVVPAAVAVGTAAEAAPIVIEIGAARVAVRRGFDRETLRQVLDVLCVGGSR